MTKEALAELYRGYIACLNARDWGDLGHFLGETVAYNGETVGLSGYRALLEGDVEAIPDLRFHIDLLIADPPMIAARLLFDCHPKDDLFGFPVNGRRVAFAENVFYALEHDRIARVWSVIDKAAVTAQLGNGG